MYVVFSCTLMMSCVKKNEKKIFLAYLILDFSLKQIHFYVFYTKMSICLKIYMKYFCVIFVKILKLNVKILK